METRLLDGIVWFLIAGYLAWNGYRRRSLTATGAGAALLLGTLTGALGGLRACSHLLTFYMAGSVSTRYRASIKQKQVLNPDRGRDAWQVASNSLFAVLLLLVLPPSRFRAAAHLAFYAACAGDTLASELGMALHPPGQSVLLLSLGSGWRWVPPGTNGGVSWQGTLAAAAAGFLLALVDLLISLFMFPSYASLSIPLVFFVGLGAALLGTSLDSLLGADLQYSGVVLVEQTKLVTNNPRPDGLHVAGYPLLTNNQVNVISSITTSIVLASFVSGLG